MPLRSQKQVMVHLDKMNSRAMRRAQDAYVRHTLGPLVESIKHAGSGKEALSQLGVSMLHRMDSGDLERVVADAGVQSGLIGRASAFPRATKRRSDEATKGG